MRKAFLASRDLPASGIKELDHRIVRPDGTVRWLLALGRTFFVGEGQARHAVRASAIALDVTERKRLEQDLLEVSRCEPSEQQKLASVEQPGENALW